MAIEFTGIHHNKRRALGVSNDEYVFLDHVYHLQVSLKSSVKNWCYKKKDKIADELGITKQGLYKMINRLIEKNLLVKDPDTGFIATTEKWYCTINYGGYDSENNSNNSKLSLQEDGKLSGQTVNSVYQDSKLSLLDTIHNKKNNNTSSSSNKPTRETQTQIPPFVADEQNEFRKKAEEYKTEVATPTYNREQTFEILKNDKLCGETFEKEIFRLNQNRAYARQKKIETLVPENAKRLFEEYVDECCLNAEKDEKFPRRISESKRHLTSFMKIKFQRDQENIINRLNRPY